MAQLTTLERKEQGLELTDSKFKIKFKEAIHPFLALLSKTKVTYKVQKINSLSAKILNLDSNRPMIFVCNHGTSFDVPIALGAIKKHTYLLAAKQPLEKVDEMFFNLNGTIYIDRKNKEDMKVSKEAMLEILSKGKNLLVYPEGTWNMTDSNIMHEMKWGIIDIAKEANALIVPMALDYDFDTRVCKYKFGEAIDVKEMELKEGIQVVRDKMATLKWDLFETKQMHERKNIDIEEERKKIMHSVEEYPKLDYEYEKSVVFHSQPNPDEVFEPIRNINK